MLGAGGGQRFGCTWVDTWPGDPSPEMQQVSGRAMCGVRRALRGWMAGTVTFGAWPAGDADGGGYRAWRGGTRAGLRGMVGASIHSGRGGDVAVPCLAAPAKSCSRRAVPATPSWPHWPPALPGGGARGPAAPGRWGHARPGPSSILRLTGSREGVSCHPGAGTEGPWARPRGTAGGGARQTGVSAPSLHPHCTLTPRSPAATGHSRARADSW